MTHGLKGTMPTTKSDLIDELSERLRLPKGKAELIVNCVFDTMTHALLQDERIEIRGFGSFEVRSYRSYDGRNPRTGETVHVAPKKLPFFKVGKELRERINGDDQADEQARGRQQHPAQAGSATAASPGREKGLDDESREPAEPSSWPPGGVTSV